MIFLGGDDFKGAGRSRRAFKKGGTSCYRSASVSGSFSTGDNKALEIRALEIVGRREGPLFLLGQVYN